jgi:hypothetical protein
MNTGTYLQHFILFETYKWALQVGVLHYTRLERFFRDKDSSLLRLFESYKENEVLLIRPLLYKCLRHVLYNFLQTWLIIFRIKLESLLRSNICRQGLESTLRVESHKGSHSGGFQLFLSHFVLLLSSSLAVARLQTILRAINKLFKRPYSINLVPLIA